MTYLTKENEVGQTVYAAISDDRIKTLNISSTYDSYGQKVSSATAGDYIGIISQSAADFANEMWNEFKENEEDEQEKRFNVGDCVLAYDDSYVFDAIIENDQLGEDDYTVEYTTCEGFTFWDGHNFKTIVIQGDDYNPEWEVVTDEVLITELDEAIENMEGGEEGFGLKGYTSSNGKWSITENFWQGSWSRYDIMLTEEAMSESF